MDVVACGAAPDKWFSGEGGLLRGQVESQSIAGSKADWAMDISYIA